MKENEKEEKESKRKHNDPGNIPIGLLNKSIGEVYIKDTLEKVIKFNKNQNYSEEISKIFYNETKKFLESVKNVAPLLNKNLDLSKKQYKELADLKKMIESIPNKNYPSYPRPGRITIEWIYGEKKKLIITELMLRHHIWSAMMNNEAISNIVSTFQDYKPKKSRSLFAIIRNGFINDLYYPIKAKGEEDPISIIRNFLNEIFSIDIIKVENIIVKSENYNPK